jgi:hypothetical protein
MFQTGTDPWLVYTYFEGGNNSGCNVTLNLSYVTGRGERNMERARERERVESPSEHVLYK